MNSKRNRLASTMEDNSKVSEFLKIYSYYESANY